MFLGGLKNILPDVPKFSEDLLGKTVSSLDQVNRIDRECHECQSTKPLDDLFTGIDENTVTCYYQWETCEDGRVWKELIQCTTADLKEDLTEQLQSFGRRVYKLSGGDLQSSNTSSKICKWEK